MSTFKPRLVECLLRREGGTVVPFDACSRWPKGRYHFKPGAMSDGRHSAEIDIEAHYERLISIPESFRPVHPDDTIRVPTPPPLSPQVPLPPSTVPARLFDPPNAHPQVPLPPSADDASDAWDPTAVLALGVNKILAMSKSYSDEQIRQLIQLEGEREDPRESLTKNLTATLRGRAE
jgi:hypothetical protein